MVVSTTDATFERDALSAQLPVLVDFWAPWCGPCRIVSPIIERIGEKMFGRVHVYKMNVDENPVTAMKYGITGIPTVLLFSGGEVKKRFIGVQAEQTYLTALQS